MSKLTKADFEILRKVITRKVPFQACPKDDTYNLIQNLLYLIDSSPGAKESILKFIKKNEGKPNSKIYEC